MTVSQILYIALSPETLYYMKPLFLLLLLFTAAAVYAQNKEAAPVYQFVKLNHGLAPGYFRSNDSLPWHKREMYKFTIIKTTDSVPAKLNTVFGVEFKVTGISNPDLHYTTEWVYPKPIKEEDGRLYGAVQTNSSISTDQEVNAGFYLLDNKQLLKGKWKLNIYVEKKLLYTHVFVLY